MYFADLLTQSFKKNHIDLGGIRMKKTIASLLSLAIIITLMFTLLIGCKKEEKENVVEEVDATIEEVTTELPEVEPEEVKSTDPLDMIKDGRYVYSFTAEGHGDFTAFFHFYEEAPELGAVFYVGYTNNGTTFTGTYTVEMKDYEYAVYMTRDEVVAAGEKTTGVAPYTITFFDWEGNEMDRCGFDGTTIYNDMDVITGMGGGNIIYTHDTDLENSMYKAVYEAEAGVAYLDFVSESDETSTLTLFHNMTYRDLVNMMVEGTWSIEKQGDGSNHFILTPNDGSATSTLKVSSDRMSANYAAEGEQEIAMINTATLAAKVTYLFEGVQNIAQYGTDAAVTLSLYDDNSCTITADVFGNIADIDQGTYQMAVDGYTFEFTFDGAGSLQSTLNPDTKEISLQYVGETKDLGAFDTSLVLNQNAVTTSESEILFSFTGNSTTFDCYADNTYIFKFESYNIEEKGTWAFDAATYSFSITQENGNVIKAAIVGDAHDMVFDYVAVASDQLKDTFTSPSDVWSAALMK